MQKPFRSLLVIFPFFALAGSGCVTVEPLPPDATSGTDTSNVELAQPKNTQKPEGYPADVPVAAGAYDFSYVKSDAHQFFGYSLPIGKDLKMQFDEVNNSVLAAGWKVDPTWQNAPGEGLITTTNMKGNENMTVTVQTIKKDGKLYFEDYYIVGFNRFPKGSP